MRLDTEMLGECQAIFANARNTAARLERYNGAPRRGSLSPAAAGRSARARPVRRLRAVGRAHRSGQTCRPAGRGDGLGRSAPSAWWWPATARSARTSRRLAEQRGRARPRTLPRQRRRRRVWSACMPARWRWSTRPSTKTSATSRSRRSWRASPWSQHRLRRPERVRPGRRRTATCARPMAADDRRRRSIRLAADRRARGRARRRRLRGAPPRSPGTASSSV